jgi:hypothetical protein
LIPDAASLNSVAKKETRDVFLPSSLAPVGVPVFQAVNVAGI